MAHFVVGRVFSSVDLLEMSHREDQNWLDGFSHEDSVCIVVGRGNDTEKGKRL